MATNKRKTTTAIVAGITALALVLGGTFAWTSISQQARNEAIVDINPGGRLHDDFNGTNKDVYVENFSSGATGVNIYARIKLTEYMEVGPDAGKDKNGSDRNVKVIYPEGAKQPVINDPDTWITYIPAETDPAHTKDVNKTVYTNYWDWELGRTGDLPYYMPTFNMNKDSLLADINGTYEGTVEGDIVHYDNYVEYKADSSKTGTEVYDWDSDLKDEDGGVITGQYDNGGVTTDDTTPIDDADVYHKENQSHTAKQISTDSTVITMTQWLALLADEDPDNDTGAFWVYDTDGWAYWAQPIEPGKTTGLLLDSIEQIRVPDDNWYYGIDVVGQFVTASDLSAFENENDGFSDNAKELMGKVAQVDNELVLTGPATIIPGTSANYTTTFKAAGVALEKQPAATWEITNVTAPADAAALLSEDTGISINNGTVTVADSVAVGTTFTVKATAGALTKELKVTVADAYEVLTLTDKGELVLPLAAGETATYKLAFPTDGDYNVTKAELYTPGDIADMADLPENIADWSFGNASYSYDPTTQLLTVTQNSKVFYALDYEDDPDEIAAYLKQLVPYYSTRLYFEDETTNNVLQLRFAVPYDFPVLVELADMDASIGVLAAFPTLEYMHPVCVDAEVMEELVQKVQEEGTVAYFDFMFNSAHWGEALFENLTPLKLSGTYKNGITYDEESNLLYLPQGFISPIIMTTTCTPETGEAFDIMILGASLINDTELKPIDINNDLTTDESTGKTIYTGAVLEGSTYYFEMNSEGDGSLLIEPVGELPDGFAISSGTINVKHEEGTQSYNQSLLTIPVSYGSESGIELKLTLTNHEGTTYNVVLTVYDSQDHIPTN